MVAPLHTARVSQHYLEANNFQLAAATTARMQMNVQIVTWPPSSKGRFGPSCHLYIKRFFPVTMSLCLCINHRFYHLPFSIYFSNYYCILQLLQFTSYLTNLVINFQTVRPFSLCPLIKFHCSQSERRDVFSMGLLTHRLCYSRAQKLVGIQEHW